MCIVGGVSRETQIKTMKETNCNILIATPGRLIDLVETENLTLEHVSTLVVDEADRMIDIGLVDQVKKIHEWCNRSDRHTVLLSASMAEKADFVDTIVTKPREELYLEADTVRDVHVGISSHINQAVRGVRDIRALVTFSYPSLTIILLECYEKTKLALRARTQVHAKLTEHVVRFFRHPHPRVRFAAIHCLITFSQDLGPNLQQNTHRLVIPNVVNLIRSESAHPRVQAHAVESLSMYVDMCQDESLMPYLKDLLLVLSQLLQSNAQLQVQSKCVAAVAAIADRAGQQFVPFYDNFVPALKSVFFQSARRGMNASGKRNTHEQDMLSGRCLECLTLIGMAVGKQRFGRDAIEIMEELVRQKKMILAVTSLKSTGPLASFMLSAWGRIGKCLGKDFAP